MRTLSLSVPMSVLAAVAAFSPVVGCAGAGGSSDPLAEQGSHGSIVSRPSSTTGGMTSSSTTSSPTTHAGTPTASSTVPAPTQGATKTNPGATTTAWNGSAPKGSVPVTGGTLLVGADGVTAVAADPDRDLVSIVDLTTQTVTAQVQLPVGAEPGRLVQDGVGQVHVLLRRGGGIADIDIVAGELIGVRQTCALPRGIAYSAANDSLVIACMSGALITMTADPSTREPMSNVNVIGSDGNLVTDLRDVILSNGTTYVTTFRSASVYAVAADGTVATPPAVLNTRVDTSAARLAANGLSGGTPQNFVPAVAWRAVVGPLGDIVIAHEGGTDRIINVSTTDDGATQVPTSTACQSSEYGGETCETIHGAPICTPPILIGAVSSVSSTGVVSDGPALPNGALPVDIIPSKDGTKYIVALAGNPGGAKSSNGSPLLNVVTVPAVSASGAAANATAFDSDLCALSFASDGISVPGQVTSVAIDVMGQTVAQTREPATLQYVTAKGVVAIPLSSVSVANVGFDLFHTNTGRG